MGLFDKIKKKEPAKTPAKKGDKLNMPPPPPLKGTPQPIPPVPHTPGQPMPHDPQPGQPTMAPQSPPVQQHTAPPIMPAQVPQQPQSTHPNGTPMQQQIPKQQPTQQHTRPTMPEWPDQHFQIPSHESTKTIQKRPEHHQEGEIPQTHPKPQVPNFIPPTHAEHVPQKPKSYEEQHIKFHQPSPHIPEGPKKAVPKELPAFPIRKEDHPKPSHSYKKPIQELRHASIKKPVPEKRDVDIPAPPPNLRSEISPLELERLEEKYLGEPPKIRAVDPEEKYDRHANLKRPLFVRTDNYRQMLNAFIDIKDDLKQNEEIIYRLENLKKNADVEYNEYKKAVEDIQRKLIYIDKSVFEP